jgi:hypothetical protein
MSLKKWNSQNTFASQKNQKKKTQSKNIPKDKQWYNTMKIPQKLSNEPNDVAKNSHQSNTPLSRFRRCSWRGHAHTGIDCGSNMGVHSVIKRCKWAPT